MKTLSIKQPWASLIMSGEKRVENRTWATTHRGPLLIHASLGYDKKGAALLDRLGIDYFGPDEAPRGAILGQVELVTIVDTRNVNGRYDARGLLDFFDAIDEYDLENDPLAFGPVCWILTEQKPLDEPIRALGKLGLWDFEGRTTDRENGKDGKTEKRKNERIETMTATYALEDGEQRRAEDPVRFYMLPLADRQHLRPGYFAQLLFTITADGDTVTEQLWVIVTQLTDSGYIGTLDSEPLSTDDLPAGSPVTFEPRHVIAFFEGSGKTGRMGKRENGRTEKRKGSKHDDD